MIIPGRTRIPAFIALIQTSQNLSADASYQLYSRNTFYLSLAYHKAWVRSIGHTNASYLRRIVVYMNGSPNSVANSLHQMHCTFVKLAPGIQSLGFYFHVLADQLNAMLDDRVKWPSLRSLKRIVIAKMIDTCTADDRAVVDQLSSRAGVRVVVFHCETGRPSLSRAYTASPSDGRGENLEETMKAVKSKRR